MRVVRHGLVTAVTAWAALSAQGQPADADALVQMRRALGGDAALRAVESFILSGSRTRIPDVGTPVDGGAEITCQLPSKYILRRTTTGPVRAPNGATYVGIRATTFEGFNLDTLIRYARDAEGRLHPWFVHNSVSPREAQRIVDRNVRDLHRDFARLGLALFGASFEGYPMELHDRGRQVREDQQVDVIEAVAPDGFAAVLYIDAASHLPVAVSWQAVPSFLSNVSGVQARITTTGPVEHAMLVSDFRIDQGLTWPHRIREFAGPRLFQDTRIQKVSLNPKIPPETFLPPR